MSRASQVASIPCLAWTMALVGCGGMTESPGFPSAPRDGGKDAALLRDAGPPDAWNDTSLPPNTADASDDGCTSGVPALCTGLRDITGCPVQGCRVDGSIECPRQGSCMLPLDPNECSWRLEGGRDLLSVGIDWSGRSSVRRVEADGGTTDVLPMQASEQDCPSGGGWFFVRDEQSITVTLCPAQCNEHLGPPETAFMLERRWMISETP